MGHRPLYKKTPACGWKILAVTLLSLAVVFALYRQISRFDPESILAQSELKEKNFAAEVTEITAPKSGVKAYLLTERSNPIIAVSFLFTGAGRAADDTTLQGEANLLAQMLGEGAGALNSQQWKESLAGKAVAIGFGADKDDFSGHLLTTKDNATQAFSWLRDALTEPRFERRDLKRIKKELKEGLRRQREHPAGELALEFSARLFAGHPYGRNPIGTTEGLDAVDPERLGRALSERLAKDNLLVGIAGDIRADEAEQMLDEVFGRLPSKATLPKTAAAEPVFDGRQEKLARESGQNIAVFAAPGVSRQDPDFYPLYVANHILGGSGLSSKLSKKIREEKGLTYGVYSYLSFDDRAPLIQAGFAATADKYAEAASLFAKEWQAFGKNGATAQEVALAKDYLRASYNLRFRETGSLAEMLTMMQKYKLGKDFLKQRNDLVEAVTAEQVNEAAKKYFNNERITGMTIGQFATETEEK